MPKKEKTPKTPRKARIKRQTTEVKVAGRLLLDGKGKSKIDSGIKFLDHMLDLFTFHGFFDLELTARGDLGVDYHHTNEDIGIVLGEAFKKSIGKARGIKRFGEASVPMEEALAWVVVDVCGRGSFSWNLPANTELKKETGGYSFDDARHFLDSFAKKSGINIKIDIIEPSPDVHHLLEAAFKSLGIAIDRATQIDKRRKGVPSTKGVIDL
ncbi:MAG: imidazoleglycerol-phosphate dehydratase [Candidatus Omnitrophota bacterium]|nr:imidazoleglycerol-phosphate dehydratase [Candidatus Omnitrophota bacterium]